MGAILLVRFKESGTPTPSQGDSFAPGFFYPPRGGQKAPPWPKGALTGLEAWFNEHMGLEFRTELACGVRAHSKDSCTSNNGDR